MQVKQNQSDLQALKKVLSFRYLSDTELDGVLKASEILEFEDQEPIVKEGEESLHFYAVLEGSITVHVNKPGEGEVYICTIGQGEVFGEAGIFLKVKRTATIRSAGKSRIFRIHRHALLNFIKDNSSSGVRILMLVIYGLLKKLRESNQELAYERRLDADQSEIDSLVEEFLNS